MADKRSRPTILLTGATGYVGGRLLTALAAAGYPVRCMARKPEFLESRVRAMEDGGTVSVVQGDCLDLASLRRATAGVDTAFYLVHSMGGSGDFADADRKAALNFGQAAREAGISRIIYLGGLGDSGEQLSKHLQSRHETGEALRSGGVPVVEFRASIILGSGSLSFELIRALVERLPAMICPSWVRVKAQPIHILDVIRYLLEGIQLPAGQERIYEIGGRDTVSYQEIMEEYARQRGLKRTMIPVPVLTPYLSSLWLGLTTPLYARVGRKLILSIKNPTVVRDDRASTTFKIRPAGLAEAIRRAMSNEDNRFAATRWSDATSSTGEHRSWGGTKFGSRLVDTRSIEVDGVLPGAAFAPIRRIGGQTGWYYGDWLWRVRGFMDLLAGGAGMRRGRRNPEDLVVGDTLDFWRVEGYEPNRRLLLVAEMKLPGRAWLEFEVKPSGNGSVIHQTAVFDPVGLLGLLYWYGIYPLHRRVFRGMLKEISRRAAAPVPAFPKAG
ncbi:MAG: SDR family oxidoreductase [Acidobacteria bacterium]|uniref:SDR family oxidoreductase n=1 Tax=Candidatus Polarisedimenticola svalbardensis TaxID=2886004 RepID=A0A8J6Y2V0_9BACT|nr:SDR family oxidoreductase [Candidatus Polarisedimenticola svalbardensis]